MLRRIPHGEGRAQRPSPVWLIRYWIPLVLFAGAFGILTDGFHSLSHAKARILVELPFIFFGVFYLSSAELRHKEHDWEYRRFLVWHRIPSIEILSITPSIFPGLGYIRLNHFVGPWGKLYFVAPPREGWPRNDAEAQAHDDAARIATGSSANKETTQSTTLQRNLRICGLLCLAGVLWGGILQFWMPWIFSSGSFDNFPTWIALPIKILLLSESWPWVIVTTAVFVAHVLRQRFGKQSWASAFIVGILVIHMIIETSR
jgi:hypothetical protein